MHCDNTTAHGIVHGTVKIQLSHAIYKLYLWIVDQQNQKNFNETWAPVIENLGDYVTKYHTAAHHRRVQPY